MIDLLLSKADIWLSYYLFIVYLFVVIRKSIIEWFRYMIYILLIDFYFPR